MQSFDGSLMDARERYERLSRDDIVKEDDAGSK